MIWANTQNQVLIPPINNQYTDIYNLTVSNDSYINTDVWLSDGSVAYVLHIPAQSSGGLSFNTNSAIPATNLNTPWTINCSANTDWQDPMVSPNNANVNINVLYKVSNN